MQTFYQIFPPIFGLSLIVIFIIFFVKSFTRPPFVPSNRASVRRMFEKIKIKKGERVVDLGCGDGRILFGSLDRSAGTAIGYEISIGVWLLASFRNLFRKKRAKIYRRSFFDADLSKVDTVFCYLLPDSLEKLSEKFRRELPRGTRIVSLGFEIKNWPAKKKFPRAGRAAPIFIYEN